MNIKHKILTSVAASALILGAVVPVLAATDATTKAKTTPSERSADRMAMSAKKGDQMIGDRITRLNTLLDRVNGMKTLSDQQKQAVVTVVQSVITNLNDLKTRIDSDTASTSMKEDIAAITQANRVYALILPQISMIAASDRVITIANMMAVVGGKLQSRLAAATNISNATALQTSLSDLNAKISDAVKQVKDAVNEIQVLVPDNGDKTVFASNSAALKDARAKIKTANDDLKAGRKDIETITKALKKAGANAPATSGPSATTPTSGSGSSTPGTTSVTP